MKTKGIDISEWQKNVDYEKVKHHVDFVILREGRRTLPDKLFFTHAAGFKKAQVPIRGVYHFLYAVNNQEVTEEAKSCIENVKKAGLPKNTRIWCDMEYDSIDKAADRGILLGNEEINLFTQTFCDYIEAQGYPAGIYTNLDFYKNRYRKAVLDKYPIWLADYEGGPDFPCMYQQATSKETVPGIAGNVDIDYYLEEEETKMGRTEEDYLKVWRSWLGFSEADGKHKKIIDLYNSHKPLARGYAVQYDDEWCDTTVSAAAIASGMVDLIGTECGCEEHVKIFKKKGIWIEDGKITPKPGYIIVYNWGDSTQPNDGYSDHIGVVESVKNGIITCIEGNKGNAVARREIPVGWEYIRGYAAPKYEEAAFKPAATDGANTYSFKPKTVRLGDKGNSVLLLQEILKARGFKGKDKKELSLDGQAGTNTIYALKAYQKTRKGKLAADGVCGEADWRDLVAI